MPLSFQPACLPVARHSLPHMQASAALALLYRTTSAVMTWPGLPHSDPRETLLLQSIAGFPGLTVDWDAKPQQIYVQQDVTAHQLDRLDLAYLQGDIRLGALPQGYAAGFSELLRVPDLMPEHAAIASRLLGPVSLCIQLAAEDQRPLLYSPMLREAVTHHLALRAAWFGNKLAYLGNDLIVCLEEPLLPSLLSPFSPIGWEEGLDLIEQVLNGLSTARGVLLGDMGSDDTDQMNETLLEVWAALLDRSFDLIQLDIYGESNRWLHMQDMLPAYLNRSGAIIWGLIPADAALLQHTTAADLVAHLEMRLHHIAALGTDIEEILQASLISTNNDLAHLSVAAAEQALYLCADVSTQLRQKYRLMDSVEAPAPPSSVPAPDSGAHSP